MRKNLLILCLIIFPYLIFAQHINISNSGNSFRVKSVSKTDLVIENQLNTIDFNKRITIEGLMYELNVDGYASSLTVGNPRLPELKKLIEVPVGATIVVEIIESSFKEIRLSDYGISNYLMPMLKSTPKNETPEFYLNRTTYRTDTYIQNAIASVEMVGNMRETRLARLSIAPIAYNPVKNTVIIFDKLVVKISFTNANLLETQVVKEKYFSSFFNTAQDGVLNAEAFAILPTNTPTYAVKYVIVADSMFRKTLQPFIQWKQKKGFKVVEAYTSNPSVGKTKTSIKEYLKGLYLNATPADPAPSFVLLIGDTAQLPVFLGVAQTSHFTDLYYCEYTNDAFPEVLYGRFSATDTNQLKIQLNKTLEYEKYLMTDPSYLGKSVLIAGYDNNYGPTHANGQINYASTNYFNTAHSLNTKLYLYPSSASNAANVIADVNAGAGIVNYTAHGSSQGWVDPAFSVSNVNSLTNAGKYPLMIGNACVTNKFDENVCFGEALVRASNKGALAYIGASDNTFWDEDFYWSVGFKTITANPTFTSANIGAYDCMFHDHGETFNKWAMTNAQIIKAGNLAVTQSGNNILYYWEIYHLLGDPSLMVYQKIPSTIIANYSPILPIGMGTFSVSTTPHALVALSRNDSLIASAFADSLGVASLNFAQTIGAGSIDIVITAQNKKPFISTLLVANPTGPYIISKNISIDDSKSNHNLIAENNEDLSINLTLSNITSFISTGLKLVLQTTDSNVIIIDSVKLTNSMSANSDRTFDSIFKIKVKPYVLNNSVVPFTIAVSDSNSNLWYSNFNVVLFAPNLVCNSMVINDAAGNNNGRLDPGESAQIIVNYENTGGANAISVFSSLSCGNPDVQSMGVSTLDTLKYSHTAQAIFNVHIGVNNIFNGSNLNFNFIAQSGLYKTQKTFIKSVGNVDEDFETNGFSKYAWVNSASNPWKISQSNVYEGMFSARSKDSLADLANSKLEISMTILCDDSISFYRKVSTEEDYDFLIFKLDNQIIDRWSGEQNWNRVIYPITAGNHTFTWEYTKDNFSFSGSDAAFVDMISFPANTTHVGIGETNSILDNVQIFPNPASSKTTIVVNTEINTLSRLNLYDLNGKLVKSQQTEIFKGGNTISFDLQNLNSGIYNLQILIENRIQNVKIAVIQ